MGVGGALGGCERLRPAGAGLLAASVTMLALGLPSSSSAAAAPPASGAAWEEGAGSASKSLRLGASLCRGGRKVGHARLIKLAAGQRRRCMLRGYGARLATRLPAPGRGAAVGGAGLGDIGRCLASGEDHGGSAGSDHRLSCLVVERWPGRPLRPLYPCSPNGT